MKRWVSCHPGPLAEKTDSKKKEFLVKCSKC